MRTQAPEVSAFPATPARTHVLPDHIIEGSVCKAASKSLDQIQAEIESLQRSTNANIVAEATNFIKEKDKMDGISWPPKPFERRHDKVEP